MAASHFPGGAPPLSVAAAGAPHLSSGLNAAENRMLQIASELDSALELQLGILGDSAPPLGTSSGATTTGRSPLAEEQRAGAGAQEALPRRCTASHVTICSLSFPPPRLCAVSFGSRRDSFRTLLRHVLARGFVFGVEICPRLCPQGGHLRKTRRTRV